MQSENQKSEKKKILLASVLKPVDDVRMYSKFAQSLIPQYELHLVGFCDSEASVKPEKQIQDVHFHPIFNFDRLGIGRWKASSRLWSLLKQIQPDLLIIHAVELIPVAALYKLRFGKKLVYDVQENYVWNIWYQKVYKSWQKPLLICIITFLETISRLVVNRYVLAEKCYLQELFFLPKENVTVLENKFLPSSQISEFSDSCQSSMEKKVHFVYTGTISESYGIKEAVFLMKQLQNDFPIRLSVVGKVTNEKLKKWLERELEGLDWVSLNIDLAPIAYSEIECVLRKADFLLLPYQPNKSTKNCIPTKMYEGLALQIPMIVQRNPIWEKICNPHHSAVFINFANPDIKSLRHQIQKKDFYKNGNVKMAFWNGKKLKMLISEILG